MTEEARIRSLAPQEVEFELDAAAGAAFELHVDGEVEATATAEAAEDGGARVRFATRRQIRGGRVVELVDADGRDTLFSAKIELKNFVFPMLEAQLRLSARVEALEREVRELRGASGGGGGDDRAVFAERLDVFYALIQEKVDRLLVRLEGDAPQGAEAAVESAPQSVALPIDRLEGVGLYDLEGEPDAPWRWIAPQTTLIFREAPPTLRAVTLRFAKFLGRTGDGMIEVTVNGQATDHLLTLSGEGGVVGLDMSGDWWRFGSSRPTTVLLSLRFRDYQRPTAVDRRALAAILHSVSLES